MILFEEAYRIVIDSAYTMGVEKVSINDSLGRVLAEDVISDMNMPPFDKSAMDGFACKKEDIKNELKVIETIPAGTAPKNKVGKGQCSRIMTGAMLPEGADCVLMVEYTQEVSENVIKFTQENTKSNICYQAEDVKVNDIVLNKEIIIQSQHIAVLSSVGCIEPLVAKQPRVGILSTGDEIVEPNTKPGISQIRNSNAYQLIAQVSKMGAVPNYMGIIEDSEEATHNAIIKAINENDVVILTGGVSMGDFDFVPKVLKRAGVDIKFQQVAVQPGKPTTFGIHKKALIFGLPGNPVSSFIQFELLTKPLLYKLMGIDHKPVAIKLPMGQEYIRKRSERESWIPVNIADNGKIIPVEYHGSAHIYSLQNADGIISIPIGKTILKEGDIVDVRQI